MYVFCAWQIPSCVHYEDSFARILVMVGLFKIISIGSEVVCCILMCCILKTSISRFLYQMCWSCIIWDMQTSPICARQFCVADIYTFGCWCINEHSHICVHYLVSVVHSCTARHFLYYMRSHQYGVPRMATSGVRMLMLVTPLRSFNRGIPQAFWRWIGFIKHPEVGVDTFAMDIKRDGHVFAFSHATGLHRTLMVSRYWTWRAIYLAYANEWP